MKIRKVSHATKAVGGSSIEVLAANEERKYAELFNGSDVGIWLALGDDAVVGTGIYVPVGASYVIDRDNLWVGQIKGIAATGSGKTMGTVEYS